MSHLIFFYSQTEHDSHKNHWKNMIQNVEKNQSINFLTYKNYFRDEGSKLVCCQSVSQKKYVAIENMLIRSIFSIYQQA